jgi:predicted AAA+ superfamily ATPase
MIEYANVGRECSLPSSTVKEYFGILEDTLIATLLWPWNRSERNKARPKLYFFDTGVLRAIQGRLDSEPSPQELGHLFETWFINEVKRIVSYGEKELNLGLWRDGHHEIDLTIERNGKIILGIEIKSGNYVRIDPSQLAFRAKFPKAPLWIVSLENARKRVLGNEIEVLSAKEALDLIRKL